MISNSIEREREKEKERTEIGNTFEAKGNQTLARSTSYLIGLSAGQSNTNTCTHTP